MGGKYLSIETTINTYLILILLALSSNLKTIETKQFKKSKMDCPLYYNLDRTLKMLTQEKTFSINDYNLLFVSSFHGKEFFPVEIISKLLLELPEIPINFQYYCSGNEYSMKSKFILIKNLKVLYYVELENNPNLVDTLKSIILNIVEIQFTYESLKEIDHSLRDVIINDGIFQNYKTNTNSTLFHFYDNTTKNNAKIKKVAENIEFLSHNNGEIRKSKDNDNFENRISERENKMEEINNSDKNIDNHLLYNNKTIPSIKLSKNFIQIVQNNIDNKGRRFLYVMIILIFCIGIVLLFIKYSLELANSSRSELNKLRDSSRKLIVDKIKIINDSIARLDLNS